MFQKSCKLDIPFAADARQHYFYNINNSSKPVKSMFFYQEKWWTRLRGRVHIFNMTYWSTALRGDTSLLGA